MLVGGVPTNGWVGGGGGYLLRSQMHGLINKESTVVNSLLNLPELECQKSIARHSLVPRVQWVLGSDVDDSCQARPVMIKEVLHKFL